MPHASLRLAATHETLSFPNGTTLTGLGGMGEVRQRRAAAGVLRSAALPAEIDTSPGFDRALQAVGITEQETLQVQATELRADASDEVTLAPAVAAGDTRPRVVLYQDESGGLSWHFAAPPRGHGGLRAAGALRFVIPLRSGASRHATSAGMPRRALRGPITKVGRKLFKVLVLPVASALLQDPVRWLAEGVEERARPYRLWRVTPDNYRSPPAAATVEAFKAWPAPGEGPVLLIVHGIFSSVEGMLAGLPREAMQRWCDRYQGRVIAFDHPTVSASPEDNAAHLLRALAAAGLGGPLTFDILCHSRGGIVSRALSERLPALGGASLCRVRSVYFAGTPNQGSPLGDADHMVDMIDLFTNCLTNLPDGPIAYSMEVLLGLVTLVGHSAAAGLPGIAALGTRSGYVVERLNRSTEKAPALYGAVAADYEPQPGRENGWVLDRLADPAMDRIFVSDGQPVANDLVVPQQGVFAANGHPSFPIDDPLVYGPTDGVWHTAFFAQPRTVTHIEAFLDRVNGVGMKKTLALPVSPGERRNGLRQGLRSGLRSGLRGAAGAAGEAIALESAALAPHASPDLIERDPVLGFPDQVEAGELRDLYVGLNPPVAGAAPSPGRMRLAFDSGTSELTLSAELSAPGFRIEGARHAGLTIRRERDKALETAIFRVTALDPGDKPIERTIDVSFWQGNDCVGGASRRVLVVPRGHSVAAAGAATPVRTSALRLEPARPRDVADLVLYVRRTEPGRDLFELDLRSAVYGNEYESRPFGRFDLDGRELAAYLAEALDPGFETFPGAEVPDAEFDDAVARWQRQLMTTLGDLGKQLWMHLPEAFREEYLRLAAAPTPPRSLFVFSDELSFPWEIVRPSGRLNGQYTELPPLGSLHVMGRWRPGTAARPQPQVMPVARMALVVPDAQAAGLPSAQAELEAISGLVAAASVVTPAARADVERLLARDDVQVVHFSGHGAVGANADLTALQLEGSTSISAMAFASTALGATAQPVLYLNACMVGRGGRVMSRAGGFAGNCLEAGWSGVIAPYWPVYDPSAAAFSVAFYRKLKGGCSIGEALQEIRAERPDDPTAQSYAYFGDPFARLRL
ncbi:DUF7379 domain-containing protein [Ideonella sp.]|uniref:DUF7379 domain-containing protein n=1 Tax=Ideonella sp. TaxID=1929293 RepID=UPI002B49CE83|nr:CHAT domain-containing protein [Ideonella sp.]HJV67659.1 CHAT domain-containing protein [Ideonella sp.]